MEEIANEGKDPTPGSPFLFLALHNLLLLLLFDACPLSCLEVRVFVRSLDHPFTLTHSQLTCSPSLSSSSVFPFHTQPPCGRVAGFSRKERESRHCSVGIGHRRETGGSTIALFSEVRVTQVQRLQSSCSLSPDPLPLVPASILNPHSLPSLSFLPPNYQSRYLLIKDSLTKSHNQTGSSMRQRMEQNEETRRRRKGYRMKKLQPAATDATKQWTTYERGDRGERGCS